MTLATIAVREVFKGEPRPQVTVVIPGVLFLSPRPDEPDRYSVTGWEQGKLSILKDAKGDQVVALGGRRPPPPGTSGPMPSWNPAGVLPPAQFRASILRRVQSRSAQP